MLSDLGQLDRHLLERTFEARHCPDPDHIEDDAAGKEDACQTSEQPFLFHIALPSSFHKIRADFNPFRYLYNTLNRGTGTSLLSGGDGNTRDVLLVPYPLPPSHLRDDLPFVFLLQRRERKDLQEDPAFLLDRLARLRSLKAARQNLPLWKSLLLGI